MKCFYNKDKDCLRRRVATMKDCLSCGFNESLKPGDVVPLDPDRPFDETLELYAKKVRDTPDMVNHPPHYTGHPSGVECIELTEHLDFCLGNALKYCWRDKGKQVEDVRKAVWYLERALENQKTKGGIFVDSPEWGPKSSTVFDAEPIGTPLWLLLLGWSKHDFTLQDCIGLLNKWLKENT